MLNPFQATYSFNIFSLVVELGSALGLWMGVSALNLFDLGKNSKKPDKYKKNIWIMESKMEFLTVVFDMFRLG